MGIDPHSQPPGCRPDYSDAARLSFPLFLRRRIALSLADQPLQLTRSRYRLFNLALVRGRIGPSHELLVRLESLLAIAQVVNRNGEKEVARRNLRSHVDDPNELARGL